MNDLKTRQINLVLWIWGSWSAYEDREQKAGQDGVAHEVRHLRECKGSFSLAAFET